MNQLISYQRHYKELIYLGVPIMIGQLGTIILGFALPSGWHALLRRTICE